MSVTRDLRRWRVWCVTEGAWVDGFLPLEMGRPQYCFNNTSHAIDQSKSDLLEIIKNDFTKSVNKWRVFCEDGDGWVEGYRSADLGPPTTCFYNNTHTITTSGSNAPQLLEVINNSMVTVREETIPVSGHIRIETVKLDVGPNEVHVKDLSWPFDIAPLSLTIHAEDINKGDHFQLDVAPDTVVGAITSDVTTGNTVINVSPTVIENINIGFYCDLFDGVQKENLGHVLDIDRINSKITVETPNTLTFSAASPTYVMMTVRYIGPHEFGVGGHISIGETKIGASYIAKHRNVRVTYTNNSDVEKDLTVLIEYLY